MDAALADINIAGLAGIFVGFCMVVVVPLVWVLLHHQRKMAALLHGRIDVEDSELPEQVRHLEAEVRELKARLHNEIIRGDDRDRLLRERTQQGS
jgi:hypothetical protein